MVPLFRNLTWILRISFGSFLTWCFRISNWLLHVGVMSCSKIVGIVSIICERLSGVFHDCVWLGWVVRIFWIMGIKTLLSWLGGSLSLRQLRCIVCIICERLSGVFHDCVWLRWIEWIFWKWFVGG